MERVLNCCPCSCRIRLLHCMLSPPCCAVFFVENSTVFLLASLYAGAEFQRGRLVRANLQCLPNSFLGLTQLTSLSRQSSCCQALRDFSCGHRTFDLLT